MRDRALDIVKHVGLRVAAPANEATTTTAPTPSTSVLTSAVHKVLRPSNTYKRARGGEARRRPTKKQKRMDRKAAQTAPLGSAASAMSLLAFGAEEGEDEDDEEEDDEGLSTDMAMSGLDEKGPNSIPKYVGRHDQGTDDETDLGGIVTYEPEKCRSIQTKAIEINRFYQDTTKWVRMPPPMVFEIRFFMYLVLRISF